MKYLHELPSSIYMKYQYEVMLSISLSYILLLSLTQSFARNFFVAERVCLSIESLVGVSANPALIL